ncbi:MAG: response regulator [Methanomassiliicoccales archaeon]|nr:response regulator [Methanomassiliicoccales archaeon]
MLRVLHVDDSLDFAEICRAHLESEGEFKVELASSAAEALALMRANSYDAIISDYQMEGMDGIEFLKAVRNAGDRTPFILFTGKGREEAAMEALNSGANSYLMKGADFVTQTGMLANVIRTACGQREAEESVQYNLSQFNLIMRSLSEVIFLVTDKGVVSYVSPSVAGLLGYAPEEVEGRHVMDLQFMDGGGNRTPGELSGLMSSLQGEGSVFSVRAKDGSVKRILIKSTMAMHGNDRLLIAVSKDVTHLLRMEEELKVRERLLSITLGQMPVAAGILEARTDKIIHVNVAAARLLGYDQDEMVGKTPAELGVLSDGGRKSLLEALPSGGMVHRLEVGLRTKEGTDQKFLVSLMKISIDEGEFMFFMVQGRAGEEMPTIAQLFTGMERGR